MATVDKIYTGTPSQLPPQGYVLQRFKDGYPNAPIEYTDSQGRRTFTPFLLMNDYTVGTGKDFADLTAFMGANNGNAAGNRDCTVKVYSGTYALNANLKTPGRLFFQASDSVVVTTTQGTIYSGCFVRFKNFTFDSDFAFNDFNYIHFQNCTFNNVLSLRRCNQIYINNCSMKQGLVLNEDGYTLVNGSTITTSTHSICLAVYHCPMIYLTSVTINNNYNASQATIGLRAYGSYIESPASAPTTINMNGTGTGSRYGFYVSDNSNLIAHAPVINKATYGFRADNMTLIRAMDNPVLNNVTTPYMPALNTLGNNQAYIVTT